MLAVSLKIKDGLRLMPVLLLAALSSCNNGGKSNNAPTNVQISGVNYSGFQNFGTQSCNFVNNSSYSCTENSAGQIVTTQIISFNSQQELCNNLRNDSLHSVAVSWGSMAIASSVRLTYVNNNCQAYPNTIGNGVFQNDTNLLRNMKCSMTVEAADGAFGNTGEMQVPITASGMRGEIYASMFRERSAWIFRLTTSRRSSNYLTVNYVYTKGTTSAGDQLKLSASLKNGAFAEITGFAGSDVSLVFENADPVVKAEVSCVVTDATNAGVQTASNDYRCNVSGTDDLDRAPVVMPVSELINNSLTFTSDESTNSVVMTAEGPFALKQGTAVFTATSNKSRSKLLNITGRANLNTPVKFKVRQLIKTVEVGCK